MIRQLAEPAITNQHGDVAVDDYVQFSMAPNQCPTVLFSFVIQQETLFKPL